MLNRRVGLLADRAGQHAWRVVLHCACAVLLAACATGAEDRTSLGALSGSATAASTAPRATASQGPGLHGTSTAPAASGSVPTASAALSATAAPDDHSPDDASAPADPDRCASPDLQWRSAHKTNYESYPDPGSEECIEFNGCTWEGLFAGCDGKRTEEWVAARNIVAAFPSFDALALHELCIRSGEQTMVVTVLDTCGDSDCDGCCTENKGDAELLIDLEKYTNQRWGLPDGDIEWADLGPAPGDACAE